MKFSKLSLLSLGASALLFSACSILGGNLEKGELISPDAVSSLNADEANDGKRVAVEGYPFIKGDITIDGDTSIDIYTEPAGAGTYITYLPMRFGEGKNTFYVPEEFTDADLVLYDNEGAAIAYDEKVLFSFQMDLQTDRERMTLGDQLVYYGMPEKVRIDRAE